MTYNVSSEMLNPIIPYLNFTHSICQLTINNFNKLLEFYNGSCLLQSKVTSNNKYSVYISYNAAATFYSTLSPQGKYQIAQLWQRPCKLDQRF